MSWLDRVARRLGYVKRNAAFAGALTGRLTASWSTSTPTTNQALHRDLKVLRARSRDLHRNADYARRFVSMVVKNVAGPTGMSLQVQALRPDGSLDERDSRTCEQAFARWKKRGVCELTGRYSFLDLERLLLTRLVVDGEVLVRRFKSRRGYQIQLISAERLADDRDVVVPGAKVVLGIELDSMNRPVAYHLKPNQAASVYGEVQAAQTERISAGEIWHLFLTEDVDQLRGIPWMVAAMRRMRDLDGYQEAAVIAARVGAAKMGFLQRKEGAADPVQLGTEEGDNGLPQIDAEPASFVGLPEGYELNSWDPDYPHEQFGAFVTACLRGIASGLDVSYHSLANDVERVNYSSARVGVLEERETWKSLQAWLIEAFYAPLYSEWLLTTITAGQLSLPVSKLDKFDNPLWQGRRWQWVDPLKDLQAAALGVQSGLTTRGRIIREMGADPEEIWRELEVENERLGPILMQPPTDPAAEPAA